MTDLESSAGVAVVVGASRGIGRALAEALADRGAPVLLLARDGEALEGVAAPLRARGARVRCAAADVTDEASLARAVERCDELGAGVSALVYAVAFAEPAGTAALALDDATARAAFEANALGALRVVRAFASRLAPGPEGPARVALLSSRAALAPPPFATAYALGKAALEALARSLALELDGARSEVFAVHPAQVATELTRARVPAERFAALPPPSRAAAGVLALLDARTPAGALHGRVFDGERARLAPAYEAASALPASALGPARAWGPLRGGAPVARDGEAARALRWLDDLANPYGPPPAVRAFFAGLAGDPLATAYPDEDEALLRAALARAHRVERAQVATGAGVTELLDRALRTFARPGEALVCAEPTWAPVRRMAHAHGLELRCVGYERDALAAGVARLDLDALARACEGARVLYLASPANPTGEALDADGARSLLGRVPGYVTVLFDEAYGEFCARPEALDARSLLSTTRSRYAPRVLALRTLSKAWGLAGLRVGCAFGDEEAVRLLARTAVPYAVSRVAAGAAVAALEGGAAWVDDALRRVRATRRRVRDELRAAGHEALASDASFLCVRLGARVDEARLEAAFGARRLVLPRGRALGGAWRLWPVGTDDDAASMRDALREAGG